MSVAVPAASNPMRPVLPSRGVAVVKSALSGDTVVLLGRATQSGTKAPEVVFTFERVTSPRMASKGNNNVDEPGAFPSREWLRAKCVGKTVQFETRKQGATAGDRVYGLLFMTNASDGTQENLAVESVRRGFATPKVFGGRDGKDDDNGESEPTVDGSDPVADYEAQLQEAFQEAKAEGAGVHAPAPLVRKLKNAGDDFQPLALIEAAKKCGGGTVKCVIEYVFDGSRFRAMVTDDGLASSGLQYGSFTLILAGVASPRVGNPRSSPPTESEPFAEEARTFVDCRLLHRELEIGLHGTDKSGSCAVGTVYHPRGNIAVELLKRGYGRVSEWSVRLMNPGDVPGFRVAENAAKRANLGLWHSYEAPQLSGAAEIVGTVVEVVTGDTLSILPEGESYDSESKLKKVSLASVRAPRGGNEKLGRPDEPYAHECKERLRVLTVGKAVKITIHYEREIPYGPTTETRPFGTVSVGRREDVGEALIAEGLANAQRHRDDDEKSPRYDQLVIAESNAMAAKKGIHSSSEYGRRTVNDLTEPRKAKSYSGSLMRAGSIKAVVEYVFGGSRYKLLIPSENCYVIFALADVRCPQPSPSSNAARATRAAEPFGDNSKRHAKLAVLQRTVEITCTGVTNGGVITGSLMVGSGAQRRDLGLELASAGLATVDQRKIDYGEAPKVLVDAQDVAQKNRIGIWSLKQKEEEVKATPSAKAKEEIATVLLSEIRSGNHIFYHVKGDESSKVIEDSMKLFTENNGTNGAPCDVKIGKVVAALFDDGSGKSWYRAKIVEKSEKGKVKVLFVDHGNVSVVPLATHLRPLDVALGTDRIPAVAKEAVLALTEVRPLADDDGHDAAIMLQRTAWGKEVTVRIYCELDGKLEIGLYESADKGAKSINEQLVAAGLARTSKPFKLDTLKRKMKDSSNLVSLSKALSAAQTEARKTRKGIWMYGDIGEDDDEE
uniref:Uncharacterized protein n=1 Tax=Trieres chinensis TaxID=1514140 RepID=A0A7S2EXZ5_TRICV|mmetsp:Transcript_7954/g.16849  ORF Transcript_7954/g.16849 Transcript_7954/m.16849 type:complete len:949 (+) Transcript_7954:108-2954(+)|eukprot:CAMPEP_0183307578 /NCGR_PEP_ID=MMETSP0160_2-20130417/18106_1 /TAXON_ID=2839 ORGANISM="Odontella Sinensis, Strain Grunow 1884" /NCGR_SAMPLE_ID=MMETSP0160_2 /ASSEMBLY_ACC=CAM_ASM_000250 /LENGTH=948 /DNA_ID=CAMNT_0025471187 /DNA_START=42 /DNA_END=2888 /DNA_ORIENTATION=-